jgi:heme/copper-type cytochrome/quinol oxidase subunit 2
MRAIVSPDGGLAVFFARLRTVSPAMLATTLGLAAAVTGATVVVAQSKKDIAVSGRKYSYSVGRDGGEIRVQQGDMVTITFSAEDIPHSFTIGDPYRIDRRAEPGKPVRFSFIADTPGEFPIQCRLTIDERCQREMRGTLRVDPK